ncbi:Dyp-type peroxidase [Streptomyces sp. NPDC020719]|uniref:Dyp-type peroxidase n=1 Tax=Streptomyces sp. NPDC020719 TaxID=3154896 RepID=UPI0033CD9B7B
MGETLRRRTLLLAVPATAVPLAAAGAAALSIAHDSTRDEETSATRPGLLRDMLPKPHQLAAALDLRPGGPSAAAALRDVITALHAADRDDIRTSLALGSALFTARETRPRQLTAMPSFPGDVLEPRRTHGDLLVQITGPSPKSVTSAWTRISAALPAWTVRWQLEGARPDNQLTDGQALTRNPFHFTEGFGNPNSTRALEERALVRADQGEPAWTVGGSYEVVRIIRLATEMWDNDSVAAQEQVIGRRRDGRWLDGTSIQEQPNFAADPSGKLTPLDAHVRRAAPDRRNPPPLVRRSYSYDRGYGDQGLIFSCFQRDLAHGFEAVQKRLAGEAMAKYVLTTGGGYFFVPPPGDDWLLQAFE